MTEDESLSCCIKDEGRPLGSGSQMQESNRPMRHALRVCVVSDRGKGSKKKSCQVRSEEMNESEPSMKCRYVKTLSKPGNERLLGTSADVIWKRAAWQPA